MSLKILQHNPLHRLRVHVLLGWGGKVGASLLGEKRDGLILLISFVGSVKKHAQSAYKEPSD